MDAGHKEKQPPRGLLWMGLSLLRLGFFGLMIPARPRRPVPKRYTAAGRGTDWICIAAIAEFAGLKSVMPSHGVTVITNFPLLSEMAEDNVAYSTPDVQFGKSLLAELAAIG